MDAKKIFGYVGLSIVCALIVTVVILSFVTVKLSPVFERPTTQISIFKYQSSSNQGYVYHMGEGDVDKEADFNSILNGVNDLGNFTVMNSLFLGLSGVNASITNEKTKTFDSLKKTENAYFIVFQWQDTQTLKNPDGSIYKDSEGKEVSFKRIGIVVDNNKEVKENKIYINDSISDSDSATSRFYYTSYSNVSGLYDMVYAIDENEDGSRGGWLPK